MKRKTHKPRDLLDVLLSCDELEHVTGGNLALDSASILKGATGLGDTAGSTATTKDGGDDNDQTGAASA